MTATGKNRLKILACVNLYFVMNLNMMSQNVDQSYLQNYSISGSVLNTFQKMLYYDYSEYKMKKTPDNYLSINTNLSLAKYTSFCLVLYSYHFNKRARELPWYAEYAYSVMHASYHPNTFGYGFMDYDQNKYSNSLKKMSECFLRGLYYLTYYIKLPDKFIDFTKLDANSFLLTSIQLGYAVRYLNKNGKTVGGLYKGKTNFQFGIYYKFYKNIFCNATIFYYPFKSTQSPWDCDYSYGFGWSKSVPFSLSFNYSSSSFNRYPWRDNAKTSNFFDGGFTVSLSYKISIHKSQKKSN